ncbi:MAG: hypothetical protein J2P24_19635 [Streptosporangiales bacterium]|nr:hypothetical protein [Streptosporangiales bacterium]MBO0892446.1 hypothetical protein [Acidothermales bacterium]
MSGYDEYERFQPTAWKSVPGFVRFAVWLWAIGVVLGLILAVLAFVLAVVLGISLPGLRSVPG